MLESGGVKTENCEKRSKMRCFFATNSFPAPVCDSNHKNWGLKTPTITRLLENRAHSYGRLSKLLETSANISAQVTEIFNELPKGRLGFLQKVNFF